MHKYLKTKDFIFHFTGNISAV